VPYPPHYPAFHRGSAPDARPAERTAAAVCTGLPTTSAHALHHAALLERAAEHTALPGNVATHPQQPSRPACPPRRRTQNGIPALSRAAVGVNSSAVSAE